MTYHFRSAAPVRTYTATHNQYQAYKTALATDFYNRCGYTDCSDKWFGGVSTFHIDHFSPISHFPQLKTTYSNLVYSCSYVNILKSNDDPNNYLDPCDNDYNQHFYRDLLGVIYPVDTSSQAKYMHKKMKLGLARYSCIWLLDKLYILKSELRKQIKTLRETGKTDEEMDALRMLAELDEAFEQYFEYLNINR